MNEQTCKTQLEKVTDEPKCKNKAELPLTTMKKHSLWQNDHRLCLATGLLVYLGEEDRLIKEN